VREEERERESKRERGRKKRRAEGVDSNPMEGKIVMEEIKPSWIGNVFQGA